MPLEPDVTPVYARKARLVEATALTAGLMETRQTLAELAGMHANTLGSVLAGSSVQYRNAHAVFTVLNRLWGRGKSRRRHVQYWDDAREDWAQDAALDQVLTFHRLAELLRRHRLDVASIAAQADVANPHAELLKNRMPVAANIAVAVFEAVRASDPALSALEPQQELIP